MFNLWNRTYVQTFNQRQIFDSKVILADSAWSNVVFSPESFNGGGIVAQEWNIDEVVDKHYNGQYSNLFIEVSTERDCKWAIVVNHNDYYRVLAYYLKELQHSFKFSDADLHMISFSFMYNNFYYGTDQTFVDGFVSETFQGIMKEVFENYTATGVLDLMSPSELPTEIAYLLVQRELIAPEAIQNKLVNAAKLVVTRLWQVHLNDFSEWLVLDTKHFLNLLKSPNTPEIVSDTCSFTDMFNMIQTDEYLHSMFFSSFPFFSSSADWESDPNFKITASRIVSAWEGLANYLVQRGIDETWSELRHSQYAEIILRYEYVVGTCAAVKYILQLDGAPETLDTPVLDLLGYDVLSECFDSKYNKTLLLITFRGMSPTFQGFIDHSFSVEDTSE